MVKLQDLDLNKGKGAKLGAPGWGKPSRGIQWQRKEYEKETCLRGCVTPTPTPSLHLQATLDIPEALKKSLDFHHKLRGLQRVA